MAKLSPLLLLLWLLPAQLWALAADGEQPIEVEADSLGVREADHISIYQGNVKLVQGSLHIRSDRLVIHFNESNELQLMQMTGKPATFRQLDDENQEMLGEADQIDYTQSNSQLELRGAASFSHAGDIIQSEQININTENNSIQAGNSESDQRVKMLIQPRQNSESTE